MVEWLAKIGATWGTALALLAALVLAAANSRRLLRMFKRGRVNREELHVEEFRRTIDELLVELETAATAIESRISVQLVRLNEAGRSIDEKLRRIELIGASSCPCAESPDRAASADVAPPANQNDHISIATEGRLAIPAGPRAGNRERVSRRAGKFVKATLDAGQSAKFAKIQQMAEDGSSSAAIAENLQVPLGEVETYLSLRQFARSQTSSQP